MIDLIIGVPLTIAAWRRGWKWWALLPMPVSYALCFITGYVWASFAEPGTTEADLESFSNVVGWVITAITYLILIAMIIKGKKHHIESEPDEVHYIEPVKRFCSHCGKEQIGNPNFCRSCGQNFLSILR